MRRFVFCVFATFAAYGCSGPSSCSGMTSIPTGRYSGVKNDNAVNVRVTSNGLTYINSNWRDLVEAFAPGGRLDIELPCKRLENVQYLGTVFIADQGNASGAGRNDLNCDPNTDLPAKIGVVINSFKLVPKAPDKVSAELSVSINTGTLYAGTQGTPCDIKCTLAFNNGTAPNTFAAVIRFTIDTKWDSMVAFSIDSLEGTEVCGGLGAADKPGCLDPDQMDLGRDRSSFCIYSFACSAADWAPLKKLVLGLASPLINAKIKAALANQGCEKCGQGLPACPTSASGETSSCMQTADSQVACGTALSCLCVDNAAPHACVPRLLGVEGRVAVAPLLASFGVAGDATMDLSVGLGSTATVDTGFSFGSRVGIQAVSVASCVTAQPAPSIVTVPAPNFDAEAKPGSAYHVGLSLSSSFLNVAFHQAQQAGALCLQLGSSNVGLINTGIFKTFLPSLGRLATRDGKDAPMMVALRPGRAPLVTVGLGTYDLLTKKPIKPLLTMTLPQLSIDVYALLDDRYARLFTITADVSLPMSLIFEGCDKVSPALGDLKMLVSNVKTANSEMLAEDPKVLENLIPAVIGYAEPALASLLQPFTLPALGSFKMKVSETKGIGNIAGSEAYNHLGIYATLLASGAACAVSAPATHASMKQAIMPKSEEMRAVVGKALPWPKAILNVSATNKEGSAEFAYKIDDGLWSTFYPAPGNEFEVSHPRFLLQGVHTIWVRSRVAEDEHGISAPVQVPFMVDFDAPSVSLTADSQSDRVVVVAHDTVTADSALQFAYALGELPAGQFGPAREISLSAIEQHGGVTVFVRDELGNIGSSTHHAPTVALRAEASQSGSVIEAPVIPAGCSSTGGLEMFGVLALAGSLNRRKKQ